MIEMKDTILSVPDFQIPPQEQNIMKYPSMMDIINSVLGEKQFNEPKDADKVIMPLDFMLERGNYMVCRADFHPQGQFLYPCSKTMNMLFRGQNHYYSNCFSSFYRLKTEKEKLLAHLHQAEFIQLLNSHPVIKYLKSHTFTRDGLPFALIVPIDEEGLAQHYGIPTEVMDFSNDLWVSAFFATTKYDNQTQTYSPYIVDESCSLSDSYGVLYFREGVMDEKNCHPIGSNYFNRPGVQSGFAYRNQIKNLNEDGNFSKIFFRHNNDDANYIFKQLDCGKTLFPSDSLVDITNRINTQERCSIAAVKPCHLLWYAKLSFNDFLVLLESKGIQVCEVSPVKFDDFLLKEEYALWIDKKRFDFLKNIYCIPIFRF